MSTRGGSDPKNTRILVIDDDEIALQAMSDVLERAGYVVHALASPIGATQVIAAQGIAAAVIDLNMPVMRGDRFIALIRSWDRIRDLPIVLVSGESTSTIRQAVAQMPGVSVVTKAHMGELLVSTLQHALSGRVDRDDAAESAPSVTSSTGATGTSSLNRMEMSSAQRSLLQSARLAQTAWREFMAGRPSSGQVVITALTTLRSDAQQLGLKNTQQVLGLALDLAANVGSSTRLPKEADASMSELLTQLVSGDVEKVRAFEQSLSLTIQRSRLERARQMLR